MRELGADEVARLRECLKALADHHNRVSVHFKGAYPSQPYETKLENFAGAVKNGASRIAVTEERDTVVCFCKIDLNGEKGKIDNMVVLPSYRGMGYGKELMDWAMAAFEKAGVRQVEVKVVDGNDVICLYEHYGFQMNAHILVRRNR